MSFSSNLFSIFLIEVQMDPYFKTTIPDITFIIGKSMTCKIYNSFI